MLWWTLRQLESKDRETRRRTAEDLGRTSGARVVDALVPLLSDVDSGVRKAAAQSLSTLGWRPADDTHRVLQALALQDWERAVSVGAPAVEPLLGLLKDEDPTVKRAAAAALGRTGDLRAVEPLAEANGCTLHPVFVPRSERPAVRTVKPYTVPDPLLAMAICTALGDILGKSRDARVDYRVLEHLFNCSLPPWDARVRQAAISALGKVGTAQAAQYLVKILLHYFPEPGNDEVEDLATEALAGMDRAVVRPALAPLFEGLKSTDSVENTEEYRVVTGDQYFHEARLRMWRVYPIRDGSRRALARILGRDFEQGEPAEKPRGGSC